MDMDHPAADGNREEEDHRPPPMSDGEMTMPLCVASPSPAWPLSPTASHQYGPVSWTLYSSPMYSPPQWYQTMMMMDLDVAGDRNLLQEYQGEPTMSESSLSVWSSPQAFSLQPSSQTMLLDEWNFDDRQVSSLEELGPLPADASHVPAALVAPQGTGSGGNPVSPTPSERVKGLLKKILKALTDVPLLVSLWASVEKEGAYVDFQREAFAIRKSIRIRSLNEASMMHDLRVYGDGFEEIVIELLSYAIAIVLGTGYMGRIRTALPPKGSSVVTRLKRPGFPSLIEASGIRFKKKKNRRLRNALKAVDPRSSNILAPHRLIFNDGRQTVPFEIMQILAIISEKYKLPLARTCVLCNYKNRCHMNGCLLHDNELAFHVADPRMWGFRDACVQQHLQVAQGVPGKAVQLGGPSYVKDVRFFCSREYPLVHYGRMFGLVSSVAVCVHSSYTGNDDYILEFFLPRDCRDDDEQTVLLESASAFIEQMARGLKIGGDADSTKLSSHHLPINVNEEQNSTSARNSQSRYCASPRNVAHASVRIHKIEQGKKKGASSKQSSRNRSLVWLHFSQESSEHSGNPVAVCKHCNNVLKARSSNGTSHLFRHLRSAHQMDLLPRSKTLNGTQLSSCSKVMQIRGRLGNPELVCDAEARLTEISDMHYSDRSSDEWLRECRANKIKHVEEMSVRLIEDCSSAEVDSTADKCSSMHGATNENNELTELGHKDVEPDKPAGNASRKRRRSEENRSIVWTHFPNVEKNADGTKAQCIYCRTWLKADSENGTSRLRRHITDHHKMDLDASPETDKKLAALAIKTKNQSKDQTAAEWGGIVPEKVPNEVIILDSQDSVGKISRLEGTLLDKINSVSEEEILVDEIHEVPDEEDDDATIERDEDVLQRRADTTTERNDVEDLDDIRDVTAVARSGPRRPTTSSRNTQGKEEKRLKISARIEESMERLFQRTREEESTRLAKQAEEESSRLAKQAEEESARLAREKEAAKSNDFSIRRCISVLNTLEVTKEEKAKAYAIFIRSKENREAFICGCEADVESTLIWLRNEMV